ncbi:HNH endonuclease [Luteibacter sp. HA06]
MWFSSPSELGLRTKSSRPYQCTGEHLQARQDGGRDIKDNIVAACWYCNMHRHRVKKPRTPDDYRAYVRRRVSMGRWCPRVR